MQTEFLTSGASRVDSIKSKNNNMNESKKQVEIHVTFLKIGEVNTLKESFDADILLRSKWHEPALDNTEGKYNKGDINFSKFWNPEIYIDNILGEPKRTSSIYVEYDINGLASVIERRRVKGTFVETMELFEFPFDVQDLSITVMSEKPIDEVELVEDPHEIHKIYKQSFIDEQEFYLYKYIESQKKELAKDRADPSLLRSGLLIQCRAARRPAYFIWNSFSVTLLICCLSFVTFAVEPALVQNRLQLSFTLVLTAVAFKFVVNQSLPRISYLTYLDRYILATMIVLAVVAFWHGIQVLVPKTYTYAGIDNIVLISIAGLVIIYNIQFVLRIFFVPYRRRRQMKHLEQEYIVKVKKQADQRNSVKEIPPKAYV